MFGLFRKKIRREIIINAESLETRVGVLEDGKLEEFQVEHPTEERIVGSIYKGRIQNLEHDLQAAFVDIGMKKNAFLHYWDMVPDEDVSGEIESNSRRRKKAPWRKRFSNHQVEARFPVGSEIIVQVTKGPIGTKGPRVTASLSIPGRYLVMMPSSRLKGVSRKIGDVKERQRLKKVLARLSVESGVGLIVRTAASGTGSRGLIRDARVLLATWRDLQQAIKEKQAPSCLYREPDLVERVVRDWLTEDVDRIMVDSKEEYENLRVMANKISRRARSKICLHEGDLPIFDKFDVERQLDEAFRRSVTLACGGVIIFDETEAMVTVDVNTGRHKGKGSQEDAILEVNMEAVLEVARQLRLRNIGGLVVIDLIDMKSKKYQNAVLREMKKALKPDRARTNVLPISELGIMEMTRQRVEESILSSNYTDCPYCRGSGKVKSVFGMSISIQRHIMEIMRKRKKSECPLALQVIVHPAVLERLRREDEQFLLDLEAKFTGRLSFKSDPNKHMEYFSINDGVSGEILYSSQEK